MQLLTPGRRGATGVRAAPPEKQECLRKADAGMRRGARREEALGMRVRREEEPRLDGERVLKEEQQVADGDSRRKLEGPRFWAGCEDRPLLAQRSIPTWGMATGSGDVYWRSQRI